MIISLCNASTSKADKNLKERIKETLSSTIEEINHLTKTSEKVSLLRRGRDDFKSSTSTRSTGSSSRTTRRRNRG